MKQAIDINCFTPDKINEVSDGVLHIDDNEKSYLEMEWQSMFNIENIPVLYASSAASGEKYTLVNCIFSSSNFNKTKYLVEELYKGDFLGKALEQNFIEAEIRVNGLTGWINENRIEIKSDSIASKKDFIVCYKVSENMTLEIKQFATGRYEKNEVCIANASLIKLSSVSPECRLKFCDYTKGFMRFLLLFTNQVPKLKKMDFMDKNGKSIEWLLRGGSTDREDADGLLQYRDLGPYLDQAFRIFYTNLAEFTKVLDLFAESIRNHTAEISFLNLTAAFEVFHKSFFQTKNEPNRMALIAELVAEGIVDNKDRNSRRWMQVVRYYDLLKSMSDVDFVKNNFPYPGKTAQKMTDSRNYYTHWVEEGEDIWSVNDLFFINNELRILLRGIILKQLEFPPSLITKLMNNRAALCYYNYEKNAYSIQYKGI